MRRQLFERFHRRLFHAEHQLKIHLHRASHQLHPKIQPQKPDARQILRFLRENNMISSIKHHSSFIESYK